MLQKIRAKRSEVLAAGTELLDLSIGEPKGPAKIASVLLGAGSGLYGLFWLLAGFTAPGLGSTGAAKENLEWLAIPSSGALVVGLVMTVVLTVRATVGRRAAPDLPLPP